MSGERKVDRKEHQREYAPGKFTTVRKHKITIPFDEKKFNPLSDNLANEINTQHALDNSQDVQNVSRVVFLKGNELWALRPDKYDVLGLDAKDVPLYDKIPAKSYPNQIIKVKRGDRMNFYVGDKSGHFKRTMPPTYKKRQAEKKELAKRLQALSHDPQPMPDYKKFSKQRKNVLKENRETLKKEKDRNLIPANEGWKVKQTKNYLEMGPEGQVSGAFPFYTDGKTYVTWPATKAAQQKYKEDMEKDARSEEKLRERKLVELNNKRERLRADDKFKEAKEVENEINVLYREQNAVERKGLTEQQYRDKYYPNRK